MIRIRCYSVLSSQIRALNTAARPSSSSQLLLPVGIFVDLDNVAPPTHSRTDAQRFAGPLQAFADRVGKLTAMQVFGNAATQRFRTREEIERRRNSDWGDWDEDHFHTGLDESGVLRCGVCGAKMRLTKKNKANGMTVEWKLKKHMKIHSSEERKRRIRQKVKKLTDKEIKKSRKFQAATLDIPVTIEQKQTNQLFRVLKENGFRCFSAGRVDEKLIQNAQKWMVRTLERSTGESSVTGSLRGCLVVYSQDSDFCDLMHEGRKKGFLVATVTPVHKQTLALEKNSDLILRNGGASIPEAASSKGVEFMRELEETWLEDQTVDLSLSDNDEGVTPAEQQDFFSWWTSNEDSNVTDADEQSSDGQVLSSTRKKKKSKAPNPLDPENRDIAERNIALIKKIQNTKKRARPLLLQKELARRLSWSVPDLVGRPNTRVGMAVALHCTERGQAIPPTFKKKPLAKPPASVAEMQKELRVRGLESTGSKNQLTKRLQCELQRELTDKRHNIIRGILSDRGLDNNGHEQEMVDRLVNAVLGIDEDLQ